MFLASTDIHPDLAARRYVQVRLIGNLNGGIPGCWKPMVLYVSLAVKKTKHFVISFSFLTFLTSPWCNLLSKASNFNATVGTQTSPFITSLDRFHQTLSLLGRLRLHLTLSPQSTNSLSVYSYKYLYNPNRTEEVRELEAPWLSK